MGQPLPHFDKFGRRLPPELPWLPPAGPEGQTGYSRHIELALKNNEYPLLFADKSWTRNVMQKDVFEYYRPSESIGMLIFNYNNYFKNRKLSVSRIGLHTSSPKATYNNLKNKAQRRTHQSFG